MHTESVKVRSRKSEEISIMLSVKMYRHYLFSRLPLFISPLERSPFAFLSFFLFC